jgi:hypothetical protein
MFRRFFLGLVLITAFGGGKLYAQAETIKLFGDTIAVGDTEFVGNYATILDCNSYIQQQCTCSCGDFWWSSVMSSNHSISLDSEMFDWGSLFFAPNKVGSDSNDFVVEKGCDPKAPDEIEFCSTLGQGYFYAVTAYAISDSFPKIRPLPLDRSGRLGWSIIMSQDSLNSIWTNHSTPTFDNPIADTTIFSNFSAIPTNGTTCLLSVADSITPINQYRALPFVRKHPLNLIFSSQNYNSFDTVIFSARMQHSNVDSVIRYALPVTWEAPFSIVQSNSDALSYTVPNPFSTQLQIGFTLAKSEDVKLQLFDLTGREWRNEEQVLGAGNQQILIDVHDLPPGSYFYIIHGAEWNRSGKVVKIEP